ncbi:MAG: tetratricopeptide repeat protein [Microcoleaceae cyanobacterium]
MPEPSADLHNTCQSLELQAIQSYELGNQYLAEDKLDQAVISYQEAIALNPNFSWAYHQLGDALSQQESWQGAIRAYHQAIEVNSDFFWSHHNLGNALSKIWNWDDAILAYHQAIQLDPDFCWSYYNLAISLGHQQQYLDAVFYHIQAYKIQPNLPGIINYLGELIQTQVQQQSLEKVLQSYCQAEQVQEGDQLKIQTRLCSRPCFLAEDLEIYIQLAQELARENYLAGAIIFYNLALKFSPNLQALSQQLQQSLSIYQNLEKKIATARQNIHQNPDSFQLQYQLGNLLSQQQNWDEAIMAYLNSIKFKPENPFWLYQGLGEKLIQRNQLEELVQIYCDAIEINPSSIWCHVNLGELLSQQGKVEESIAYYQAANYYKIQQFHPDWMESLENLKPVHHPDFIILGTQKGGTTSLYYYLAQHPQIMPSLIKEIEFWGSKFNRGLTWYLAHFPPIPTHETVLTGEATPSYFDDWEVPERLFNVFPDTKLIILLRNPVERAISHYHQWIDLNWEWRPLDQAMDLAIEQLQQSNHQVWNQPNNYVARGVYIEFIKKWRSIFSEEQILILKSEDFYENPEGVLREVCNFLNLPLVKLLNYKKYNSRTYPTAEISIRQKLYYYFFPCIQELEEFTERKFNWEF